MKEAIRQVKGFAFDYGGTLDTAGNHWGMVIWHAFGRCGVDVEEQLFREAYVQTERTLGREPIIGADFTFRKTLEVKLAMELEYIAAHGGGSGVMAKAGALLDDLYPRVVEETGRSRRVLTQLGRDYPMVLVSNFYGNLDTVLAEFGLDGLFEAVLESAKCGVRKPSAALWQMGIDALGLENAEVAVVGDSFKNDIAPALELGCPTVMIMGEPWTENGVAAGKAHCEINDLEELL